MGTCRLCLCWMSPAGKELGWNRKTNMAGSSCLCRSPASGQFPRGEDCWGRSRQPGGRGAARHGLTGESRRAKFTRVVALAGQIGGPSSPEFCWTVVFDEWPGAANVVRNHAKVRNFFHHGFSPSLRLRNCHARDIGCHALAWWPRLAVFSACGPCDRAHIMQHFSCLPPLT